MWTGVFEVELHDNRRMLSRVAAFVTWAAVAASLVFWTLRLVVQPAAVPAHATVVSAAPAHSGDLARLFGADALPSQPSLAAAPVVQPDARFRLVGVVAPRTSAGGGTGVALIATDGKPAKAYRVGAAVDGDLVLLAAQDRSRWNRALISEGTALVEHALRSGRAGPYALQAARWPSGRSPWE